MLARLAADDLRGRTRSAFGLRRGERVEIALVTSKRWSGFANHLGDLRARIEINTDLPLHDFRLLDLAAACWAEGRQLGLDDAVGYAKGRGVPDTLLATL